MTTLVVIRHGNTFEADEEPRRVGARTDLPLTKSGQEQAEKLGIMLKNKGLAPDAVYSGPLQRTIQTAHIASEAAEKSSFPEVEEFLREIDYGKDENKPESVVVSRLGKEAIEKWEKEALIPEGWHLDVGGVIDGWNNLAQLIKNQEKNNVVWAVTSNGIARFAPHVTGDFNRFASEHGLKLKTGACGILTCNAHGQWHVDAWNLRG
ncbi:MAG: histidine phosphatase family protein [Alphaproteobacteria bacterium]|nr:histidine phosphatase family protein [Alphaproteobacteria bacterium]